MELVESAAVRHVMLERRRFDPNLLPPEAQPYKQWIWDAGALCDDVPPEVVAAVITAESQWDPLANKGEAGAAYGMGQFMPETWSEFGQDGDGDGVKDVFNGADAIMATGTYLCHLATLIRGYLANNQIPGLVGEGNVRNLMLVGYNQGPNIYLPPHTWVKDGKTIPINYDSEGIPDSEDGNGTSGREYLEMILPNIEKYLSATASTTHRAEILRRAKRWADLGLGYSWTTYFDGYRMDCSGFVSMAWGLPPDGLTTDTLHQVAHPIEKDELLPGDILLNDAPGIYGHTLIFAGWVDDTRTHYYTYEESGDRGAHYGTVPYPYWPGKGTYKEYRLNSLRD
ncbi:lytic murein transglycosylase [Yinghuangia sp. YIM S09857]|uniref:lytic murein transglycosylase n=1 Tax=Yinghuangia sp. YIM S09857 TaxID=3436929 RepID=UPI003F533FE1